jgi:hypothetical protein
MPMWHEVIEAWGYSALAFDWQGLGPAGPVIRSQEEAMSVRKRLDHEGWRE